MSKIDFLKEQIVEARTFVNRLMSELPEDLWYVIPEGTDSNFIWQVGHLLVSQNFHTLTAITGVNERVGRLVPIQKYNRMFKYYFKFTQTFCTSKFYIITIQYL